MVGKRMKKKEVTIETRKIGGVGERGRCIKREI